jgi:hypothetical protein
MIAFDPGAGAKPLHVNLAASTPNGTSYSAAMITTTSAASGSRRHGGDTWELSGVTGFTYLHYGPAVTFTLHLQTAGGTTLPGSFTSGPVQIATRDTISIPTATLRDLSRSTIPTLIRHANGSVSVRVIRKSHIRAGRAAADQPFGGSGGASCPRLEDTRTIPSSRPVCLRHCRLESRGTAQRQHRQGKTNRRVPAAQERGRSSFVLLPPGPGGIHLPEWSA